MASAKRHLPSISTETIAFALLILIIASAAIYAFTHIEGSTNYGDDPNYLYLASTVVHGSFTESPNYIFSVRLMSFMPIAFFYALFGISNLTSTLWNILSFLGIIAVTFYTVRLLYDTKSALLAAFLTSIFPLVTKYAVTLGEDVPLTFLLSLAVLLFLQAERSKDRWRYFASGVLFVASYLISYEASVIIAFVLLYALIEVAEKKIKIDTRTSLFFAYGIVIAFAVTFLYSFINTGNPLITITTNLRFYSGVGTTVNGLPTIPTADTNLSFYIDSMFNYHITNIILQSGGIQYAVQNLQNTIFANINPSPYGLYFYLIIPSAAAVLLIDRLKNKKAYLLMFWLAFGWLFLEFGPMHVGINLSPFQITYLLAHRIDRFLMVLAVPLCGIIGIALSKLLPDKSAYLPLGAVCVVFILAILYANNVAVSNFWYYWQYYPESIALQVANFLKPYALANYTIYVEAWYNNGAVSFTGANLPSYMGYPSDPHYLVVPSNYSCSSFMNRSYVVWSGHLGCGRLTNALNITTPSDIPQYIIDTEQPNLVYTPTNVYYAS